MNLLQYFSTPEVRSAFHINEKVKDVVPFEWNILGKYQSPYESSSWIYDIFAKYGYRMLHVTANVDGILSGTGAWKWIKKRNFTVKTPWTAWISKDEQLIGYMKEYN